MDLIPALASAVGIDEKQASALAGAVLGTARTQADSATASKLESAVPELGSWIDAAQDASDVPNEAPTDSFLGGLASLAGSGAGNALLGAVAGEEAQEKAQLVAVLAKVGLSPAQAAMAAPVLIGFVEERLGDQWTDRLLAAAPILAGLQDPTAKAASPAGDLGNVAASVLGGLFKS